MTRKQKRLALIAGLGLVLALATTFVLVALSRQIVFFYTPTQLAERQIEPGQPIRLGGLVKEGSWTKDGETNRFVVTDGTHELAASFVGIVPDLFREGQGVIAEGTMGGTGAFVASKVLAKHDEKYVPKDVVEALKQSGEWRPDEGGEGNPM